MLYEAHDALEDCRALASLVQHHQIPHHVLLENSFTFDYAVSKCQYRIQKDANYGSLVPLIEQEVVTKYMAQTIAASGLCFVHLQTVCKRDSFQGLVNIFKEDSNGNPRVTKCSKFAIDILIISMNKGN